MLLNFYNFREYNLLWVFVMKQEGNGRSVRRVIYAASKQCYEGRMLTSYDSRNEAFRKIENIPSRGYLELLVAMQNKEEDKKMRRKMCL